MSEIEILAGRINEFKHKFPGRVEFSDVDSFSVVHNLTYLYWLEWARTDYLFSLGLEKKIDFFKHELPIMTVHHTVNYFSSLNFPDNYEVLTRVPKIGESSIIFENIIRKTDTAEANIVLHAKSVLVYVDFESKVPQRMPDLIRNLVSEFEGTGDENFR